METFNVTFNVILSRAQLYALTASFISTDMQHMENSAQFSQIKWQLEPDEDCRSYEVTDLFTSMPMDKTR